MTSLDEELLDSLLQIFYDFVLNDDNEHSEEFNEGYKKGMLRIIEEVNNLTKR